MGAVSGLSIRVLWVSVDAWVKCVGALDVGGEIGVLSMWVVGMGVGEVDG